MTEIGELIVLDRVVELDPGNRAVALRNVPHTLAIFDSHFPRSPVLPGVLVLGSMALLAAQLLEAETERPWALARAEQVRYRHFIQPGDQMEITVEVKESGPDAAVLSAVVAVDGRRVTTARALHMAPVDTRTEPT